jgi:hypothetical protein
MIKRNSVSPWRIRVVEQRQAFLASHGATKGKLQPNEAQ